MAVNYLTTCREAIERTAGYMLEDRGHSCLITASLAQGDSGIPEVEAMNRFGK